MILRCRICNNLIAKQLYGGKYYNVCSDACFDELFWQDYLSHASEYILIRGCLYEIGSEDALEGHKGFAGQRFKIRDNKGMLIQTTNLRLIGQPPDSLIDAFTWEGVIE